MGHRHFTGQCLQLADFCLQTHSPLCQSGGRIKAAKVKLVDDGQHKNLKCHHMHLWPPCHDVQGLTLGTRLDKGPLKLKEAQKIHKVGANKAQTGQIIQIGRGKTQAAQLV